MRPGRIRARMFLFLGCGSLLCAGILPYALSLAGREMTSFPNQALGLAGLLGFRRGLRRGPGTSQNREQRYSFHTFNSFHL